MITLGPVPTLIDSMPGRRRLSRASMTLFVVVFALLAFGANGSVRAEQVAKIWDVCFSPAGNCADLILSEISRAKRSIHVQAYSFTSRDIAEALVVAKNRGVSVEVILDRGQPKARGGMFGFFVDQGVPLWIDTCCAIAHNKVIIIDGERVLTGSYNFTEAARKRNAENLLLLRDPVLARTYLDNWQMHKAGAQRHAAR